MLRHAFKEWAVICQALAEGRQALILRKGGIAEHEGEFRVEHRRFWLYPTYVHQQAEGVRAEARPLLTQIEAERPPRGVVRLSHFAEVVGIYRVHEPLLADMIYHLHLWSDETVRQRFAYRTPGIYVLPVRVYRAAAVHEIVETPEYEGCRSWVELVQELPTEGATPVLDDAAMTAVQEQLHMLLNPTAYA